MTIYFIRRVNLDKETDMQRRKTIKVMWRHRAKESWRLPEAGKRNGKNSPSLPSEGTNCSMWILDFCISLFCVAIQTRTFIKKRNLLLIVLEARQSNIKVPASNEGLLAISSHDGKLEGEKGLEKVKRLNSQPQVLLEPAFKW